jgi:hypothetical protein
VLGQLSTLINKISLSAAAGFNEEESVTGIVIWSSTFCAGEEVEVMRGSNRTTNDDLA